MANQVSKSYHVLWDESSLFFIGCSPFGHHEFAVSFVYKHKLYVRLFQVLDLFHLCDGRENDAK